MKRDDIRTTKANILESYVFVERSTEQVPSESRKIIFAFPFGFFLGFPQIHIPFVQDAIEESTSN